MVRLAFAKRPPLLVPSSQSPLKSQSGSQLSAMPLVDKSWTEIGTAKVAIPLGTAAIMPCLSPFGSDSTFTRSAQRSSYPCRRINPRTAARYRQSCLWDTLASPDQIVARSALRASLQQIGNRYQRTGKRERRTVPQRTDHRVRLGIGSNVFRQMWLRCNHPLRDPATVASNSRGTTTTNNSNREQVYPRTGRGPRNITRRPAHLVQVFDLGEISMPTTDAGTANTSSTIHLILASKSELSQMTS